MTYLAMAAVMLIGIITTLVIREPQVNRVSKHYQRRDYFRLVTVFFVAVFSFVLCYVFSGNFTEALKQQFQLKDAFLLFSIEALRFIASGAAAVGMGTILVKLGAVNKQMAFETWVHPVADFFKRYGMKLALVLLLLIGFYRVSDIIAGVISNVFYQDLNFSKEQIAEAVKVYGVIFSLVGGFLGGLLAQRMNIMKLMFVGAVLASSTNLIFIGLVKSGQQLSDVQVSVGQQQYQTQADEVGYWKVAVPSQVLATQDEIQVRAQYQTGDTPSRLVSMPYLHQTEIETAQLQFLPLTSDNRISENEASNSIVVRGQYAGPALTEQQKIVLQLDGQNFDAKLDAQGIFTAAIAGQLLADSPSKQLQAVLLNRQQTVQQHSQTYQVDLNTHEGNALDVDIQPLPIVQSSSNNMVEIQGKVIKPYSTAWLYFAIIVDNLASGLAGAAFIAFLSSLTSVSFTAVQYAIFSSLMTLTPKILGGYSGTIVTNIGYPNFFLMTTLIGIPILILVVWVAKLLRDHQHIQAKPIEQKDE